MYWVRFERITPIRQSIINKINADVGLKAVNNEKIQTVIEANTSSEIITQAVEEIEFDFFNQDTGVDYEEN